MKTILLTIFVFAAAAFGWALPAGNISQANNEFAFDIYGRIKDEPGNLFFSPYSLSTALTMAFEGARHQTADEMREMLYLPSDETDWRSDATAFINTINTPGKSYTLSIANALWAEKSYPFQEKYLNLLKVTYAAQAQNLDFKLDPEISRVTINSWVSGKTNDRINDLLPKGSIVPVTRLVLTNAVYFKGIWERPFDKKATQPQPFWTDPKSSVQVSMMSMEGKSFNYAGNDQAQLLEIPYKGRDLSMIIILPHDKDITNFEKTLTFDQIQQWEAGMAWQRVDVYVPRFKLEWEKEMSTILGSLGMKLAFDPGSADFSGMSDKMPDGNLYISGVFHKAWIETNEEGTEAAAATAVVMMPMALASPPSSVPKVFRADHPFVFIIRDNATHHILFMGRVVSPQEK